MSLPTTQVSGLAINNRFIVCQYWVQPEIGQLFQARRCFLELCSENTFSHLCSHYFVQVRKYFLESCSEKYLFTVVFSRGSLELLRLLEGHEYGGQVVLVRLRIRIVSEK